MCRDGYRAGLPRSEMPTTADEAVCQRGTARASPSAMRRAALLVGVVDGDCVTPMLANLLEHIEVSGGANATVEPRAVDVVAAAAGDGLALAADLLDDGKVAPLNGVLRIRSLD